MSQQIGQRVSSHRHAKGWTQAALAAQVGIPVDRLARMECGREGFRAGVLADIASALDVPLAELVVGHGWSPVWN